MLLNATPAAANPDWNGALFSTRSNEAHYSQDAMQWASAVDRFDAQHIQPLIPAAHAVCADGKMTGCRFAIWQLQLMLWRNLPVHEQLARVDGAVNALPYVADRLNWGVADRWETPEEMFDRGGDCEGFAVAKYHALLALGFDKNAMRIAIVWDAQDREEHAVLIVRAADDTWLLDNKLAEPQPAADFVARYRLIYSVGPDGARIPVTQPSAVAAAFAGARLSENGRMLVWKVQPRKPAKRATAAPTPLMVAEAVTPARMGMDQGRLDVAVISITPIATPLGMAGLSAQAGLSGNIGDPVLVSVDDLNAPVAAQLAIWADEGRRHMDHVSGVMSRFHLIDGPAFVGPTGMFARPLATG